MVWNEMAGTVDGKITYYYFNREAIHMRTMLSLMVRTLNSKYSGATLICFMALSFWFGQHMRDMNLFAASGGVATVFGLFSLIRFTTIEKYLNQNQIVRSSTGITGKPIGPEEAERIQRENIERARIRIKAELQSELVGIALTVVGTLVWAYGTYVPIFR
jgi:hypothetical protein